MAGRNETLAGAQVDIPRGATEPHDVTFRSGGDHHEDHRLTLGGPPHPVIVTIRDDRDYIRVLLYSCYTTITGWGVLLRLTSGWKGMKARGLVVIAI